jgi:hypothetical protein
MPEDLASEVLPDLSPSPATNSHDSPPPESSGTFRRRDLESYSLETLSAILDP